MTIEIMLAVLIVLIFILLVVVLIKSGRSDVAEEFGRSRQEMQQYFTGFSDFLLKRMNEISTQQGTLLENIRKTVEHKLSVLQEDNSRKLEEMRRTVDEKLHSTLEKRLGEAFKQVGDRLEKVHQGLGEMQKLATGVGDLKNVLTNVKQRGSLGEIQLENQLNQLLSPQQYEKNVKTKEGSADYVEFAIKLPGKNSGDGEEMEKTIWLPLDSKFPIQPYELLQDAYTDGDKTAVDKASKKLASEVKNFAKTIRDKYIDPPGTTDFALMYLPIEGLYAEILRSAGLFESLQREYRVVPVGPTTLAAILNSLQMGFRSLAIEKRSSEVWKLLGAVKTHFGKFGDLLDKTRKKLDEAGKSIDDATKKSRYIEGRLSKVEELPENESHSLVVPSED